MAKYNISEKKEKEAAYRSLVSPQLMDEMKEKILNIIVMQKKYKDKEYSAKKLAEDLGLAYKVYLGRGKRSLPHELHFFCKQVQNRRGHDNSGRQALSGFEDGGGERYGGLFKQAVILCVVL